MRKKIEVGVMHYTNGNIDYMLYMLVTHKHKNVRLEIISPSEAKKLLGDGVYFFDFEEKYERNSK